MSQRKEGDSSYGGKRGPTPVMPEVMESELVRDKDSKLYPVVDPGKTLEDVTTTTEVDTTVDTYNELSSLPARATKQIVDNT